ncbi:MAG: tetratricopeptide repeat protein [Pseudobacteriovorax sp.]|nr:tetratricopeptide repeat protein [Pseudobacteriovorax sp.]
MSKIDIENAYIFSERPELRDAVRKCLKNNGLLTSSIQNVTKPADIHRAVEEEKFAYLILDWNMGADVVIAILEANRKESALESHPTLLLAAANDENIVKTAAEYFVTYLCLGEITTDVVKQQVDGLVAEYRKLSPIRQMLLNVENAKRQNNSDLAIQLLEKLLSVTPGNPRVVVELAEVLISLDRWDDAEDLLRPNLDSDPPYARLKHLYAKCKLRKNDHDSAIASLKGAQLISPYNTERLLEIADVYLDIDRIDEAEGAYEDILNIAPNSKTAKLGKSKTKLLSGEINEALGLIRECGNSNRDLSSVFNTAAVVAIKQEKFDQGFELYQRAMKLLAKDPPLLARIVYNMGIGFVKSGDKDKGLLCFQKSSKLDPDFSNASHNAKVLSESEDNSPVFDDNEFHSIEMDESIGGDVVDISSKTTDKHEIQDSDVVDTLDLDSIFNDVENF